MAVVAPHENRRWQRGLRPLAWWFLLVLVLFGIRTHERLSERTRLHFSVLLQGQPLPSEVFATLDGQPFESGQNLSIGSHKFVVTHPKGEPYSTNLSIWYGPHDLGAINLKRAMGTLVITVNPPAPLLSVRGPEWSVTLTNSTGINKIVPTDQYTVESEYAHWGRADDVTVNAGMTTTWPITPKLGAVQLSCNQADAQFQLLAPNGRQVESGILPSFVRELPEGDYKVVSVHHQHQLDQTVAITARMTNDHPVEFLYGKAVLETEPAGASVLDGGGRDYGLTPLTFTELSPGTLKFILHRAGYESVPVTLEIVANETATFRTNLVSAGYAEAMKAGRQFMETTDYGQALQSFNDALVAKPGDTDALALQREATGFGHLQRAKTLGSQADYLGGGRELTLALESLPDNGEIKNLMADYKQHEPEQIERMRLERLNRAKEVFDELITTEPDAKLFDDHEIKTIGNGGNVQASAHIVSRTRFRITSKTGGQGNDTGWPRKCVRR